VFRATAVGYRHRRFDPVETQSLEQIGLFT
jgi:hypothetical protein